MAMVIDISTHKKKLGHKSDVHALIKPRVQAILQETIASALHRGRVELYNFDGEPHTFHDVGHEERVMVFINTAYKHSGYEVTAQEPQTMFGIENNYNVFYTPSGQHYLVLSENGIPIAEYNPERFTLNVLFDLFGNGCDVNKSVNIFKGIVQDINEKYWKTIKFRTSWKHSAEKEALAKRAKERAKTQVARDLREAKEKVQRYEEKIRSFQQELRTAHQNLVAYMKKSALGEDMIKEAESKVEKEFDLIVSLPKVKDLRIEGRKFFVDTEELYMYDKHNNRYHAGSYTIELIPEESDVRFTGNNGRRSYWSHSDPHPHVSGGTGSACLGNLAPTIAELSSRNELYALTLTAIDFLENVNIDDSAGAFVINWDKVDESGNVIKEGRMDARPGDEEEEEEYFEVYGSVDADGTLHDPTEVDEDERDVNYTYVEAINGNTVQEWVRDSGIDFDDNEVEQ